MIAGKLSGVFLIAATLVTLIATLGNLTAVDALTGKELMVTSGNLKILFGLPESAFSGNKLLWTYGRTFNVAKERSYYGYTQHADNYGNLWGECVSSVKALTKTSTSTPQWMKGRQAINAVGLATGTVIATFNSAGRYSGHCAIIKVYVKNSAGQRIGFEVWDQNWTKVYSNGVFGKHTLYCSGMGTSDADNYFVVRVP